VHWWGWDISAGGDIKRIMVKLKVRDMLIYVLEKNNITRQGYILW
jgi:hypothetical protein